MVDVERALDEAGLTNPHVREYVAYWAGITEPDRVEVVSAADDARLVAGGARGRRAAARRRGPLLLAQLLQGHRALRGAHDRRHQQGGRQGRLQQLAARRRDDRAAHRADERASAGKTMYVIPYLMAPPGSPLEAYAAGVELTDNRPVVLHMIRMARVGASYINDLADPDTFVRAVHVTGDLANLGQGTPEDQRYFVTVADERTILHFGSSYGGNALLGKIAHGLRQACYDGRASGEFLAEQFMLLGITDKETGKKYHVCGGFPSASGKTNLAMTLAPDALGDRYHVEFYGDDIAWLWVGDDGKLYAHEPGVRRLRRRQGHQREDQPDRARLDRRRVAARSSPTSPTTSRPRRSGGRAGPRTRPTTSRAGWTGRASRSPTAPPTTRSPWAHPNSRFTTTLANVPNVAPDFEDPAGVPIDAIIFGGRTRDREPLVRAITDLAEGVYDGLTLGAEATFAADGLEGLLRYDPMSMRPFMSYAEGDYAAHWLKIIGAATDQPIFAHVNWFQRGEDGHFLWPGYRENLRALLWLMQFKDGEVTGRQTPGRRHPDRGGARPRRPRDHRRGPREHAHHRRRPLAPGDGLPRGAPQAVRRPARGDLGGPPPRRRCARRGGLSAARLAGVTPCYLLSPGVAAPGKRQ